MSSVCETDGLLGRMDNESSLEKLVTLRRDLGSSEALTRMITDRSDY
jgi:hypothetical protein